MILKNIHGAEIYKDNELTVKETVQAAMNKGVDLRFIDLRKANLKSFKFMGCDLRHACFWGADLSGAVFQDAITSLSDCRLTDYSDAQFIDCDLSQSDFSGARFYNALFERCNLTATRFSHLSFFQATLVAPLSINKAIFNYRGEHDLQLKDAIAACRAQGLVGLDAKEDNKGFFRISR